MTDHHEGPSPGGIHPRLSRRAALRGVGGAGAALAGGMFLATRPSVSASQLGATLNQSTPVADDTPTTGAPTIVLVHGGFADASSWSGVIELLLADGHQVVAPANPLRGLLEDSAYVTSVVSAIEGPVLLVGHSYAGAVITNVGAQVPNAVGLVYVAAFVPDEGETLGEVLATYPDLGLGAALRPASVPPSEAEVELRLDPALYHDVFAADLPTETTAVLAVSQRPFAAAALDTPSGPAAWKTLPSWYAVATGDHAINPDQERFYAERAGSITIEVDGSHSVAVSQPAVIADLIKSAVASLA